ncbi:MAG: tRNA preQ1(34) S-adenosylmethionine ribosyltransferase-isomerase QueA [Verrucomicrobia bacterium]|nr:tRNA preQ1(34) S-adenosylmethionine ribosyltransferase-isomerase QueA [Verrucomicrobiota bacterium]
MRTDEFDYKLPEELIAQSPAQRRDMSRLLVLDRNSDGVRHREFRDILDYLNPGDLLVFNDSRVIHARLKAVKHQSAGRIEVFLVEENARNDWWTLVRPGKRVREDCILEILNPDDSGSGIYARTVEIDHTGRRRMVFSGTDNLMNDLENIGQIPLPPYVKRAPNTGRIDDAQRYQTVYGRVPGSVAAPTAGLHFTQGILNELRDKGVESCFVTLHVGPGTFTPVKADSVENHSMHEERYFLDPHAARSIQQARDEGRRVIAVGTTSVRVLESVALEHGGHIMPASGKTRIFIHPPFEFKVIDGMLTNFHLPKSTLLMLVCAFADPNGVRGKELVLDAYQQAAAKRYRFYSYGDAMLII